MAGIEVATGELMPDVGPFLDGFGDVLQITLKIKGKPYRCECGCNVFHHPDKHNLKLYKCNGCPDTFEAW